MPTGYVLSLITCIWYLACFGANIFKLLNLSLLSVQWYSNKLCNKPQRRCVSRITDGVIGVNGEDRICLFIVQVRYSGRVILC